MSGAYTSVPDVLDYLYQLIGGLPECTPPVTVSDGWPGVFQPQTMVCIGGGPEDDEQSTTRDFAVMGTGPNNLLEEYDVLIYIRAWTGGTDQKPARDNAFTLAKAIEAAIRADMNLGGTIAHYYPAHLNASRLRQTKADTATAGRVAEIRLTLHVKHRY